MDSTPSISRAHGEKIRPCEFCSKKFVRSDVLRRHYKTCPSRGNRPIPGPLKKGKQRRACDSCAVSKLSCDLENPCESCLVNNNKCSYVRIFGTAVPSTQERRDRLPAPLGHLDIGGTNIFDSLPGTHQLQSKASIPFLLNYTSSNTRSLKDAFGCSIPTSGSPATPLTDNPALFDSAEVLWACDETATDMPEFPNLPSTLDELFPDYFFPIRDFVSAKLKNASDYASDETALFEDVTFDLYSSRNRLTNELIDHLTAVSLSFPKDHPQSSPNTSLAKGTALFSRSSMDTLIEIYFSQWHRHSPIIHRATFDANKVSLPLLLSILLTGALLSPSSEHVSMAKDMLELAEECAFRNVLFNDLVSGSLSQPPSETHRYFEALQAAFSMAQIQLREGSLATRRRARANLFDQIIIAIRTMSLLDTKSLQSQTSIRNLDFEGFGGTEAQIRLVCGVFNLDASFTIFYKMKPRLLAQELSISMPCSVSAYLAQTLAECQKSLLMEPSPSMHSMAGILEIFLGNNWDAERTKLQTMTILHLFVLVLSLLQIRMGGGHFDAVCPIVTRP